MKQIALKFWALTLCTFLFAVSCVKTEIAINEENPIDNQEELIDNQKTEPVYRTITFEFPQDEATKVSLAADGKTAWEVGDEIFIHGQKVGYSGEEYYSRTVTLAAEDISADGKTATFQFEDIIVDKSWGRSGYNATMFAAYPASAVAPYSNGTSWYYSTGFSTSNTLLLGACNDVNVNDGNTFQFIHLSGVLSFVVSGDFDTYVFTGNGGTEVVGYDTFAVRIDSDNEFGDKNAIPYSGGSGIKSAGPKTTLTGGVVADGSTINYLYFPGGVNLAEGFTIKFLKEGDEVKRVSTSTAKNIAMGKYLKLGDITSHLYTYVPPATHDATHPAIAGATDICADGAEAANCYLIPASELSGEEVFKFKAVKGNSTVGVGAINEVVVLWETYNNAEEVTANTVIAQADFDKQAGDDDYWITFKMPETIHTGNAVIAAKNSLGDILWSWHIWVPALMPKSSTYSDLFGGKAIMDHNLGALINAGSNMSVPETAESYGLFYQWGRKDPFPGAQSATSTSKATTSVAFEARSTVAITVAESIKHPTQFAYVAETAVSPTWDGQNWNSENNNSLWDDGGSKAIYDPCPAGYRVPVFNDEFNLWKSADWSFDTANYRASKSGMVIPYAGYMDDCGGGLNYPSARTKVWGATANSDKSGYCIYFKADTYSATSTHKAGGAVVRCVEE